MRIILNNLTKNHFSELIYKNKNIMWTIADLAVIISKKHIDIKDELESLRKEILEMKSLIRELKIIILEKD